MSKITYPVYSLRTILDAIEKENLTDDAWGFKSENCIWVFEDAMEKDEIWKELVTPLTGWESFTFTGLLNRVRYFALKEGICE